MPNYDYKCPTCGAIKEVLHKIAEEPIIVCTCGAEMTKQIGKGACIHFNGSGFYETDYKSKPKERPHEHNASPDSD